MSNEEEGWIAEFEGVGAQALENHLAMAGACEHPRLVLAARALAHRRTREAPAHANQRPAGRVRAGARIPISHGADVDPVTPPDSCALQQARAEHVAARIGMDREQADMNMVLDDLAAGPCVLDRMLAR